jgi:hypothetical protein
MSVAQFKGGVPPSRATWHEELEESKKDMGLLMEFSGAAGSGTLRPLARKRPILKLWDQRKTPVQESEPFLFEDLFRETGT